MTALFHAHPHDHFYYCSLITTGEALRPYLTAWSTEALDEAVRKGDGSANLRQDLKWSHNDTPFYCYGDKYFDDVGRLFAALPDSGTFSTWEEWEPEYTFRLSVMEEAMARLDRTGLFGNGLRRAGIVINVEVMPPDNSNRARALRLNPSEALTDWLKEAGEFD